MLYPSSNRAGLFDSIHLSDKNGVYASAESATVPTGYETKDAVRAKLGSEEYELRMPTFSMLDYTQKGVRFIFDKDAKTIGVAYIPHLHARVYGGARRFVDLTHLRQGPQPKPEKPADPQGLKAGAAIVDITPKSTDWIDPRYRENYKPHDKIFARAVVFEKDGLSVALVGADLFGMGYIECSAMIAKAKAGGLTQLIVASSHNHTAPDTLGVYGHYPVEYNQFLVEAISGVAIEAFKIESQSKNSEAPLANSRWMGHESRVTFETRETRASSTLQFPFSTDGEDGKPIATVVNFACHVEGIQEGLLQLTADFPGYMCDKIAADGGGVPVFLNGDWEAW